MKIAGALALLLIPLFTVASFTGSLSEAFFMIVTFAFMFWLLAHVLRFADRFK